MRSGQGIALTELNGDTAITKNHYNPHPDTIREQSTRSTRQCQRDSSAVSDVPTPTEELVTPTLVKPENSLCSTLTEAASGRGTIYVNQ
jgi:hypothetical protein